MNKITSAIPRLLRLVALVLLLTAFVGEMQAQSGKRRIIEHEVRKSETIYSIARRYGTTVDKVYELNSWARERIKEGDRLLIITQDTRVTSGTAAAQTEPRRHTIAAGETLYRVARTYGVSEEALAQANPGISAEHFPVGTVLRIPSEEASQASASPQAASEARPVRIALLLPMLRTPRYLEFYQGFLMGMNDLKKNGISMQLTVLESESDEAISEHIASGAIQYGYDLVIGGVNDSQIEQLAGAVKQGYYIVPFASATSVSSSRLVRINQSPTEVADAVAADFVRRYASRKVYLAQRTGDREDYFVERLKQELSRAGIQARAVDVARNNLSQLGEDAIVVPISAEKALAEETITAIAASKATLFGYPQWQSYGESFIQQLHRQTAVIFSTFFFDAESTEGRTFLTKFNAWYSKKLMNSFPKYGVLGYDLARYFIRACATSGQEFPTEQHLLASDGLQLDIKLAESDGKSGGYVNHSYYLITFAPNGTVSRLSL